MVTAMSPCKTPRQVVKKKTKLPWPMLLRQLMARLTCRIPSWPKARAFSQVPTRTLHWKPLMPTKS